MTLLNLFHNLLEKNLIAETEFHDQDVDHAIIWKINYTRDI